MFRIISAKHPIWLAGFRPFFALAILYAAVLPLLWVLILSGFIPLPPFLNPLQWHAHEMIFGFAGAVLIGFLLTASKNWVQVRGIHGVPLMCLVGFWMSERLIYNFANIQNSILRHVLLSLFFLTSVAYLLKTLLSNRQRDTFKDNYFFYVLLLLILVAKNLLLESDSYRHGIAMSIGLLRLAFAVMFERTITQFMKNTENLSLTRWSWLDFSIKLSVLLAVFHSFIPPQVAALVLLTAGVLLFFRWILWQPQIGIRKFSNATMYIGYLGLVFHFLIEALRLIEIKIGFESAGLHTFTMLCMGVVIPSMMIRIAQGHTGRKPSFTGWDKLAIGSMLLAAFFRLVLPSWLTGFYQTWLLLAAIFWALCFILLAFRLIPFLLQPRIDGKEH